MRKLFLVKIDMKKILKLLNLLKKKNAKINSESKFKKMKLKF